MTTTTAPKRRNRGLKAWVISLGVVLLAALVALALALSGLISVPGITQATGEIVLQGADEAGLDPFAEGLAGPTAGTAPQPVARPVVTAGSAVVSGASVGLYGGTNDNSRCDAGQLIAFLGSNPSKAQAWVSALNADPNLRWASGALTTAEIPAYVATLTPLVLLTDTLVTNHGFANGAPTPFSSVLQAGTAVLVDRFGVPRARCLCGNPLLPPTTPPATATVTGTPWPGFDLTNVVIVVQTNGANDVFVVVPYPAGGSPITIAAGNCVIGQACPSPWTGGPTSAATPAPTAAPTATSTAAPTTAPTSPPTAAPLPDPSTVVLPDVTLCSDGSVDGDLTQYDMVVSNTQAQPVDIFWFTVTAEGCVPQYVTTIPAGGTYPDAWSNHGISWAATISGTGTTISQLLATQTTMDWTI